MYFSVTVVKHTLIVLLVGTMAMSKWKLVNGQECPCERATFLDAIDESTLPDASICRLHTEDRPWFSSVYFDDSLENTVIRYRYCERAVTRTLTKEICVASIGAETVLFSAANSPSCSEWNTKAIPENTNFRAFLGPPRVVPNTNDSCSSSLFPQDDYSPQCWKSEFGSSHAVLAYSSGGTICFRGQHVHTGNCAASGAPSARCDGATAQCFARDSPGKRVFYENVNFSRRGEPDSEYSVFWVEIELDPVGDVDDNGNVGEEDEDDSSSSSSSSSPELNILLSIVLCLFAFRNIIS